MYFSQVLSIHLLTQHSFQVLLTGPLTLHLAQPTGLQSRQVVLLAGEQMPLLSPVVGIKLWLSYDIKPDFLQAVH